MVTNFYSAHVGELQNRVEKALDATDFEGLVLHSGTPFRYFADDQEAPFHPIPHFAHWLPLEGPGHLLLIRPGERPLVVRYAPEDFWYEQLPLGDPFWAGCFDIRQVGGKDKVFKELPKNGTFAFHGDCAQFAGENGFAPEAINPEGLVARLDWSRSYKTDYEIGCIAEATRLAAQAHRAAGEAFEAGASELEIHYAYLTGSACAEASLPFPAIIALDEKAAILHYTGKRPEGRGKVLLVDAGVVYLGYASDITRTWTRPSCESLFQELVRRFHDLQQDLCAMVRPGPTFPEIHDKAHLAIGDLLHDVGIIRIEGAQALERGLTKAFFPHGLGHFLGIQVHDVAGHQREPAGGKEPPPDKYPSLRTTRRLEEGQVLTIEPGLYFIEMLLRKHRDGADRDAIDWQLIDRLAPCGGIRIEDNVVVTADGNRNLTREHLR